MIIHMEEESMKISFYYEAETRKGLKQGTVLVDDEKGLPPHKLKEAARNAVDTVLCTKDPDIGILDIMVLLDRSEKQSA